MLLANHFDSSMSRVDRYIGSSTGAQRAKGAFSFSATAVGLGFRGILG